MPAVYIGDVGRANPVVPASVNPGDLPDPLTEGDDPLTVGEAATTYKMINQGQRNDPGRTTDYERAKYHYARILYSDRHFQHEYDGLTTCLLTRRVSPRDPETREVLSRYEVAELLNVSALRRSIRETIDYHLDSFRYSWCAVTTPGDRTGTPYEMIYLWVQDPENEVTTDHLGPAIERHVERCPAAIEWEHRYRVDGSGDAIRIEHDPPRMELESERQTELVERQDIPPYDPTAGAVKLGSSIAGLAVDAYYDDNQPDPLPGVFEGAAIGWALRTVKGGQKWVRFADSVPDLPGEPD